MWYGSLHRVGHCLLARENELEACVLTRTCNREVFAMLRRRGRDHTEMPFGHCTPGT